MVVLMNDCWWDSSARVFRNMFPAGMFGVFSALLLFVR